MNSCFKTNWMKAELRSFPISSSKESGNILVYVVMVMLIFAVLGATMVSLFSTSTGSTATANDLRRAIYLSESGIRYAASELRNNGFSTTEINKLNNTIYKSSPSGEFDITVFGAWFISSTAQYVSNGAIAVEVEKGKIPSGFFDKNLPEVIPDLFIVAVGNDPSLNSDAVAKVTGFSTTPGNYTSFEFIVSDDFNVSKKIKPDSEPGIVGMAVHPLENGTFTPSGDSTAHLDLPRSALNIFPKTRGSFIFKEGIYFYETAKDEGDRFRLYNVTVSKGVEVSTKPIDKSADYIILNYNNYFITSKSSYGNVTYGGDLDHAVAFRTSGPTSDHRLPTIQATLPDMQQKETNADYISGGVDAKGAYMQVGGISGSNIGAMWFKETLNLGGATDYCDAGECLFKIGMRAFFTLEYSGSGDGLIFALLNGALNQIGSVGGDFESPELLGYAGDSRLNNSGSFLDTAGIKGLQPPKIGLEFDTKRNWDQTFETKPVDFCSGSSLRQNTRNDPDPSSSTRDYLQYVYWGSDTVNVPCRTTPVNRSSSYDDNRHDAAADGSQDWVIGLSGVVNTSPVIASDGKTIYVTSNSASLNRGALYFIELDTDGYPKSTWNNPIYGDYPATSPVLASDGTGTIYVGFGNKLHAFAPDKSIKPGFPFNTAGTVTKPAIGGDGTIYIVANVAPKFGYVYAIRPDGSLKPGWTFNPQLIVSVVAAPYVTAPVMSTDNSRVYVAAREGSIYAFRATNGSVDWQRQPGGIINAPVGVDASAVYTGTNDKKVYALNATNGSAIWTSVLTAAEDYSSSPVAAGGTVYIGNYDDHLYAINASNGTSKWQYFAAGNVQSTPFVDSNGTIYFGSDIRDFFADNNNVRALYSDGTEKWRFATGGDVRGTPAVKSDGTVYIGSFNFNFYAINQFANPKSIRDKLITSVLDGGVVKVGGIPVTVTSENNWLNGDATKGPWAVRMEVYRSSDPNVTEPVGYYKYELRSWVRQCNQVDCGDVIGTFYDDTQVTYSPVQRLPQMTQTINLSSTDNANFQNFLFGFTSQTATGDIQTSTIRNFKLSFVRPTSPTIACDPSWPEGTTCP